MIFSQIVIHNFIQKFQNYDIFSKTKTLRLVENQIIVIKYD